MLRILVGNKSDLPRAVPEARVAQFAEENRLEYHELSCVLEKKFVEAFERILESVLRLVPPLPKPEQLMKKNIIIGKKLLQSAKYQLVS